MHLPIYPYLYLDVCVHVYIWMCLSVCLLQEHCIVTCFDVADDDAGDGDAGENDGSDDD